MGAEPMLTREEVEREEETIRQQIRELPDEQRRIFYETFDRQIRDPDTYAVLNYLFLAGLHHFYLGKWFRGLFNLLVFITGIVCLFTGYALTGILLIVGISLIELYAMFRSQVIVQAHNNALMKNILNNLKTS